MSDVVIRAENLGKKYLIGHQAERNSTLRDSLTQTARGFARSARDMLRGRQLVAGDTVEEFWALKDVNFEIRRGEVVGIIGRNGAGKSTLLKILSRITEPTTGRVEIRGRVASLLEVGTGFHPELTGRENIFLNGAILGMTRAEIRKKFDEIVDFAGVEQFLDTPVKRYSSGMYVRLAFAVAANLEPDVLVIDEVLAVGDAEFQKKCLGKMKEVAGGGRTVLFVSHNMIAIGRLCATAVLLKSGMVELQGDVARTVACYRATGEEIISQPLANRRDRRGNGILKFTDVAISAPDGSSPVMGDDIDIRLNYHAIQNMRTVNFTIHFCDLDGKVIVRASTWESGTPTSIAAGEGTVTCRLPRLPLLANRYTLMLAASLPPTFEHLDYIEEALMFELKEADVFHTNRIPRLGTFYHHSFWHSPSSQCIIRSRPTS